MAQRGNPLNFTGVAREKVIPIYIAQTEHQYKYKMNQKYQVICADPPWTYQPWSTKEVQGNRVVSCHYGTMSLPDIKALPVADYADKNCALFLWVTDPLLQEGLDVIQSWGFSFKTVGFTWVKKTKFNKFFTGLGYWTRGNSEMCLLATKGKPPRKSKSVKRLVVSPRREHSRKPDEIYRDYIPALVDGPYLELFARTQRPGWDIAFSNQAQKFVPPEDEFISFT
jgi:N6-adenosine-specific RNA methylase IME4